MLQTLHFPSGFVPNTTTLICEKHFTLDSFSVWGNYFPIVNFASINFNTFKGNTGKKRLNHYYRLKDDISIFTDPESGPKIADDDFIGPLSQMLLFFSLKLSVQLASGWQYNVADDEKSVCLFVLQFLPKLGVTVKHSIVIDYRKKVSVTVAGKVKSLSNFNWLPCASLKKWKDLEQIMQQLSHGIELHNDAEDTIKHCVERLEEIVFDDDKKEKKKEIIVDQLKNLKNSEARHNRYTITSLLAAFQLRNISTA